jgi:hypothetical protein
MSAPQAGADLGSTDHVDWPAQVSLMVSAWLNLWSRDYFRDFHRCDPGRGSRRHKMRHDRAADTAVRAIFLRSWGQNDHHVERNDADATTNISIAATSWA